VEKYLELYRHLHGMDYVALRLGNPYGSRQRLDHVQGAVAVFLGKALYGREVQIWGDGSVARDYFYIDDLVSAFIRAIENKTPSRLYNIGSGYAVSLNELLDKIQKVTGKKLKTRYLPARKLDVPVNCVDISRANKELDWRPEISLEDGMGRTWKWLNS
jgi:UDP-glucose 4-epimerase